MGQLFNFCELPQLQTTLQVEVASAELARARFAQEYGRRIDSAAAEMSFRLKTLPHDGIVLQRQLGEKTRAGGGLSLWTGELRSNASTMFAAGSHVPPALYNSTFPVLVKVCAGYALEDHVALSVEARLLAALDRHPHVVSLLGFASLGSPMMLVMALPAGGRLRAYLSRDGATLQPFQRCLLARGIASAMSYLESLAIVHRSLSLDTVAVGNGPDDPKLVDFGKEGATSMLRKGMEL